MIRAVTQSRTVSSVVIMFVFPFRSGGAAQVLRRQVLSRCGLEVEDGDHGGVADEQQEAQADQDLRDLHALVGLAGLALQVRPVRAGAWSARGR